ncbi:DUF4282 domain-containing protein [Trabulsiella odontotermitis]|uniref:DUF4282 domain-containing protein n=1 Tax=Trabulsiella odontotermitis TaxID=379893 RepID=A0A0L0GZA1_9ENTR|nr:DUF4282 domain-containing protein [Trabulsiella odontotermitis]KNC94031.1 hypothetical protein GM31_16880 [Trabulsiella odontotermitis]
MYRFDWMITPKIISFIFWLCTFCTVIWVVFGVQDSEIGFPFRCILGFLSIVSVRVFLEFIMVAFKNNEYLRRLVELQEQDAKQ